MLRLTGPNAFFVSLRKRVKVINLNPQAVKKKMAIQNKRQISPFFRPSTSCRELDPSRLNEGGGIEATLRSNSTKYHESCRLVFSNPKLERARKRAASAEGT